MDSNQRLNALVTGGGRRIGRTIAIELGRAGYNVIVHYNRSKEGALDAASSIEKLGVKAWTVCADLSVENQVASLISKAERLAGGLDLLVNSASIFPNDNILEFDWIALESNLRVNAYAPLILARGLSKSGPGGRIVNILDSRFTSYDREHASYHISKRVLFTMTGMLALELAPDFQVNAVAPGLILPPPGQDEEYVTSREKELPLQTHGDPVDVARAVLFLAQSNFITGQTIFVDGGRHLNSSSYC